jgi:hypothetical protein
VIDPAALARFGPFFAVTTHTGSLGPPWRTMSDLVTDATPLAARVAQVRAALAASAGRDDIEHRVAASVAHLGLTARLVAPALGLAVLGDPDPEIDLTAVYWQDQLGGPFPLSLPESVLRSDPPGSAPARSDTASPDVCLRAFLDGPVLELVKATRTAVPLAPHVLWGNVASAIHSAGQLVRASHPELGARAVGIVDGALAHPLLRAEHDQLDGRFRRRSCCLIYRISGPGPISSRSLCGDCALAT